jgi:hypothetical protein
MEKNNLILFVQSLVLLPVMTMSLAFSGIHNTNIYSGTSQNVLAQKVNIEADGILALNQAVVPKVASFADLPTDLKVDPALDQSAQILKAEAQAIDGYFARHDMPLRGLGATMAIESELNNIDWRLLAAITVRESTGGKNACDNSKHNAFGWGSCKIGFKSDEEAIKTIAQNLGGNNPLTAKSYNNKSVIQILHAYNPPSIIPKYAEQVMSIMNDIGDEHITVVATTVTT